MQALSAETTAVPLRSCSPLKPLSHLPPARCRQARVPAAELSSATQQADETQLWSTNLLTVHQLGRTASAVQQRVMDHQDVLRKPSADLAVALRFRRLGPLLTVRAAAIPWRGILPDYIRVHASIWIWLSQM